MQKDTNPAVFERTPRFRALLPFGIFVVFYAGLSILANDFYKISMPVAFLVASAFGLMMDHKRPLQQKVEIYARGMGETNIMIMCLIFILAGSFAAMAKGMGAVDSAVLIARSLIPDRLLLTGIFLVSCFISLAIGTSCGTLAAVASVSVIASASLVIVNVAAAAPFANEKPVSPDAAHKVTLLNATADETVAVLPPEANVADIRPNSTFIPSSLQFSSVVIAVSAPSPVQVAAAAGFGPMTVNEPAVNCGTRESPTV